MGLTSHKGTIVKPAYSKALSAIFQFISLEQAAGKPVYSSDLYSLGVTAIYLLTGMQPQQIATDPQTAEMMWRQYANQLSPMMAGIIDQVIAYHPRDRYPSARAMLDTLQSIANPIPATQPPLTRPPVVSAPPPTIPVAPQFNHQGNHQNNHQNSPNGILLGSLIAGGLIGASVIISQVLSKPSQPIAETTISPTATPSNIASPLPETPVVSPSTVKSPIAIPQVIETPKFTPTSISKPTYVTPTTNNYLWLSQRPVIDADLNDKNGVELDIMRNTIFAVHGRKFDTPGLQDYFNQQSWYTPKYSPKEFPSKLLTKLEQQNVDYIARYQDKYNVRHFKK